MPEDDFGIKLKASKKLKKIEMFFLTLCLLFIIRLRFPTGKSIAEITLVYKHVITRKWENGIKVVRFLFAFNVRPAIVKTGNFSLTCVIYDHFSCLLSS